MKTWLNAVACIATISLVGTGASAGITPTIGPASVRVAVSGITVLPYANDRTDAKTFGSYSAQPNGVIVSTADVEAGKQPYLRASASAGRDGGGNFIVSGNSSISLSYGVVLTADTWADAQTLIDYMTTIAPLRPDPISPEVLWGIRGLDLKGRTSINVSRKLTDEAAVAFGNASTAVRLAALGTPFFEDAILSRSCSTFPSDLAICDGYDSAGDPIFTPFTAYLAVGFSPYDLNFYGYVTLVASASGNVYDIGTPLFSSLAIIDPVLRLPAGFGGDPRHFTINLAPGIGNGPPPPPPPGVPEPASWALLIAGFGLVGASARRRRVAACGTNQGVLT